MIEIKAFSNSATSELLQQVEDNFERYKQEKPWAAAAMKTMHHGVIDTRLKPARKIDLLADPPKQKGHYDLENSIRLHQALPNLTPVQARDPRLWAYLAHETFWEYMRNRWAVESRKKESDPITYIRTHYFVAKQDSRALSRHGIARLWWHGYLTFDQSRKNPYELTNVLLYQLDITQTILERSLGRNRTVRLAFLNFLLDHQAIFLRPGEKAKSAVRFLAKSLNLHGGACLLDAMGGDGLKRYFDQVLPRIEKEFA
jgi:hypothetical protein